MNITRMYLHWVDMESPVNAREKIFESSKSIIIQPLLRKKKKF